MRLRRVNKHQRVALVVGIGVGLILIGTWISSWNSNAGLGYALPRRVASYTPSGAFGWQPWQLLLIWLGLAGVWLVASLWILRSRDTTPGDSDGAKL